MPDLTSLRDLAPHVVVPPLEGLDRLARQRRRRTAGLATTAVAGIALATVLASGIGGRESAPDPVAPTPTPPTTSTTPSAPETIGDFPALTPEEVRDHPDATSQDVATGGQTAPGVAARTWTVCLDDCPRASEPEPGEQQHALEVTADGYETSGLYRLGNGFPNISPTVDDWFFVDAFDAGSRLVNGSGEARELGTGEDVGVTEVAGPLVYASTGLAYVDLDDDTVHALRGGFWDWDSAEDSWHWGAVYLVPSSRVTRQGLTWQNADGSFGVHMLPIDFDQYSTQMLRSGRPGTMSAVDPGGPQRLLHVSTDYGETWDVRVMPESWGTGTSLPADWETWVDVWPTWETP